MRAAVSTLALTIAVAALGCGGEQSASTAPPVAAAPTEPDFDAAALASRALLGDLSPHVRGSRLGEGRLAETLDPRPPLGEPP